MKRRMLYSVLFLAIVWLAASVQAHTVPVADPYITEWFVTTDDNQIIYGDTVLLRSWKNAEPLDVPLQDAVLLIGDVSVAQYAKWRNEK
jgi:hypothetical protein